MKTKRFMIKEELKNYGIILEDIRSLLKKAKLRAYKAVDNIRVQTYWQVGGRIAREEFEHKDRADYGRRLISQLFRDLGFAERLIYRMLQFYKLYPILSQVATELSWSHYVELMSVKDKKERRMYELLSIKNTWSRNALREQIKKQIVKSYKKSQVIKLSPKATQLLPQDIFKNSYDFDFLELKQDFKEKDLKDALLNKFEAFIKELGSDFLRKN